MNVRTRDSIYKGVTEFRRLVTGCSLAPCPLSFFLARLAQRYIHLILASARQTTLKGKNGVRGCSSSVFWRQCTSLSMIAHASNPSRDRYQAVVLPSFPSVEMLKCCGVSGYRVDINGSSKLSITFVNTRLTSLVGAPSPSSGKPYELDALQFPNWFAVFPIVGIVIS